MSNIDLNNFEYHITFKHIYNYFINWDSSLMVSIDYRHKMMSGSNYNVMNIVTNELIEDGYCRGKLPDFIKKSNLPSKVEYTDRFYYDNELPIINDDKSTKCRVYINILYRHILCTSYEPKDVKHNTYKWQPKIILNIGEEVQMSRECELIPIIKVM